MYIQDIEFTYESTTKGKYFLITTKTDYKKASIEAKDMLKYIYPNRPPTISNTQAHQMKAPSSTTTYQPTHKHSCNFMSPTQSQKHNSTKDLNSSFMKNPTPKKKRHQRNLPTHP